VLATLVTFVLHARSTKLDPQNEEWTAIITFIILPLYFSLRRV
jgi:hypothetical protein